MEQLLKKKFGFPVGWKDLGKAGWYLMDGMTVRDLCGLCKNECRIARFNSSTKTFLYCPKCLTEVEPLK